jgi:hypothetical protein
MNEFELLFFPALENQQGKYPENKQSTNHKFLRPPLRLKSYNYQFLQHITTQGKAVPYPCR